MKMKRIAIYCVTYNSYECLTNFLLSIKNSVKLSTASIDITIYIADNTEKNTKEIGRDVEGINVIPFAFHKNYGYFGAIHRMMNETDYQSFDLVIISNVDIELSTDFIDRVVDNQGLDSNSNIGWIAPQIYSKAEQRDRNPKMLSRYSLRKLKALHFLFQHPALYHLYRLSAYKRKKYIKHQPGEIYGGHGSFIILTRTYFERCGIINYPVFLFGEEIYLAEQCRKHGLKVVYDPSIKVIDTEHASTSKMRSRFYCNCNAKALEYIMSAFY